MTLLELLKLLRSKIVFVVGLPVVCAVVCLVAGLVLIHPSYSATSTAVTNASFYLAKSYADNAAADASKDGVEVTETATSASYSFAFEAVGSDADAVVEAANSAANNTKDQVNAAFSGTATTVTEASAAEDTTPSLWKYALVALLAGLFVAIVIVVIEDMVKRRVHDWTSVEETMGVRYLGTCGGNEAVRERLAVAVRLAGRGDEEASQSVCIVPTGENEAAALVARELGELPSEYAVKAVAAPPLSKGPEAIIEARKADSCVLAVQEDSSSFNDLETVVRELGIAGVEPAGFVYVGRKPGKAKHSASK